MAWFALGLVVVLIAYVATRRGLPLLTPRAPDAPGAPDVEPDPERRRETRQLLTAFRSGEFAISPDADREDRRVLERAITLLCEHIGADCAVLWRPDEENVGRLVAAAWAPTRQPPELAESARLLVELSASEQQSTFNAGGDRLTILAVGVMLAEERGALSVHFNDEPTMGRTAITEWTSRHARAIADLYEIVRARALVATRNQKLRAMIRTATTLQGSRDPLALEQMLARDACVVTGAEWAVVVRWDPVQRLGVPTHFGESAPDFGPQPTARQGSIVGEVCRTGAPKAFADARPLLSTRDPVFDGAPLPSGTRSLLVVPLRRSDREAPIGAMVLGHRERGALSMNDGHAANDLGTIAAGALETAWAVQEATERARTDQLTGLPNRRHFDEIFARILGETDRYGGRSALVLVDVDHFKKVNDTYGHEAGDAVLIAVGRALNEERRTTDFVARLGGEELAMLLPQTDEVGALEVAERLRRRIESLTVTTAAGPVRVTASFGVALYAARAGAGARLFERADKALYAAKHAGRNRVELAGA